jgi:hypothetical protein
LSKHCVAEIESTEDDPGRRAAAKFLAKDEARRIAANIAKLPGAIAVRAKSLGSQCLKEKK